MTRPTRHDVRQGVVLRQLLDARQRDRVDQLQPKGAYEVVTRQMVDDLRIELRTLRTRIDSLFSVVVGAIVIDVIFRLAGLG